jgi:hypothetical protein
LTVFAGCSQPAAAPRSGVEAVQSQQSRATADTLLATSPYKEAEQVWLVPKDTKLYELKKTLETEAPEVLPPGDREDASKLPLWFRVYFRKLHQRSNSSTPMPTSGPYQYPRTANRMLQDLIDNPDKVVDPSRVIF